MKRFKVDKLVRDRALELDDSFANCGVKSTLRILDADEYRYRLAQKLHEEANEVLEARENQELKVELADVLEVVEAIAKSHGLSKIDIEQAKQEKNQQRGRFAKGVYTAYVDVPLESEYVAYYEGNSSRYPEMRPMLYNHRLMSFHESTKELWGETEVEKYVFRIALDMADYHDQNRAKPKDLYCIILEAIVEIRKEVAWINYIGLANSHVPIYKKKEDDIKNLDYISIMTELLSNIEAIAGKHKSSTILMKIHDNILFANHQTQMGFYQNQGYTSIANKHRDTMENGPCVMYKAI